MSTVEKRAREEIQNKVQEQTLKTEKRAREYIQKKTVEKKAREDIQNKVKSRKESCGRDQEQR